MARVDQKTSNRVTKTGTFPSPMANVARPVQTAMAVISRAPQKPSNFGPWACGAQTKLDARSKANELFSAEYRKMATKEKKKSGNSDKPYHPIVKLIFRRPKSALDRSKLGI